MTFFILILLGIIQGITEFLPISSSGHLVLLYNIFGIENNTVFLSILLHLATLFSIIIYYRKDIGCLIRHPLCSTNKKIIVTTISTCLLVLPLKNFIDKSFGGNFLPTCFVITGILIWISDWFSSSKKPSQNSSFEKVLSEDITNLPLSYKQAIIIGLAQGMACIPGISRSGTTIATSKIMGVKNCNSKYSFLISIPIILGSLLLEILGGVSLKNVNFLGLSLSFLICFLVGLFSIKIMNKLISQSKLKYFSFYLFFLAGFLIINSLFLHLF